MPAIAEHRGIGARVTITLIGLVPALGCDAGYEPPIVIIIDDGGTAVDSSAPPDVAGESEDDVSLDASSSDEESFSSDDGSRDIGTLVPDTGHPETMTDGDAIADLSISDRADTGPAVPDACAAPNELDAQSPMSWTVGSNATCSALSVKCPDLSSPIGMTYAVRADGFCPTSDFSLCTPSTVVIWFGSPPSSKEYDVYPVYSLNDVPTVASNQVALQIQQIQEAGLVTWWAQSGKVHVITTNGKADMQLVNVQATFAKGQGVTTLAGQLTCP
jgi:hypothetical protein